MAEEDREDLLDKFTETQEERSLREHSEKVAESNDDTFLDNLNKEVQSGAIRGPPKEKPKWRPKVKRSQAPAATKQETNPSPEIHMSFSDAADSNLQGVPAEWAEMDLIGPPKKK